jgi:tetratricopeptide (TPR) repeat protein
MAQRSRKTRQSPPKAQLSVPLLVLLAFGLGVGATWLVMRGSGGVEKPAIENFLPPSAGPTSAVPQLGLAPVAGPPDVSQLAPAEAARTVANWNYDRQDWSHAIEHYQEAIRRGADNPDVRTDLGNCFRFLDQPQKALEQYELAQKENPQHENSLFNQISLFSEVLHDNERAESVAREFIARFPLSPRAESVRQILSQLQNTNKSSR